MAKSDEIFEKEEYDSPTEQIEVVKKPKRKLTEKQLANLAKGRAKMAEKRKAKREAEKKVLKEKKLIVKEEKKAVKEIKSQKKEQKKKQKELLREQHIEESYFQELKQREIDQLRSDKISRFQQIRTRYLTNCKTTKEFTELKKHLDEIEEDDIVDEIKLKKKLLNMISKYTKPKAEKIDLPKEEEQNLKIEVDLKGIEKK